VAHGVKPIFDVKNGVSLIKKYKLKAVSQEQILLTYGFKNYGESDL
jgi:hypothetical protein